MADDFFSEIGSTIQKITQSAVGKTSAAVESTKLNAQISNEQKEIEKLYQSIGELVYRGVKDGDFEVSDDLADIISEIDSHRLVIRNARKSLADVMQKKLCPKCHEIIAADAAFCPKCGYAISSARLPRTERQVEAIEARVTEVDILPVDETYMGE